MRVRGFAPPRVLVMRVRRPRDPSDHRVFVPMWLNTADADWDDNRLCDGYGWMVSRQLATPMDEADACAWLLKLGETNSPERAYFRYEYSSVPV